MLAMTLRRAAEPARAMAKMGLGAVGLPLASVAAGMGAGPPGPGVADTHWHRMAQQNAAWLSLFVNKSAQNAYRAATEYTVMGGRGKNILWKPFQVSGSWFATARVTAGDTPLLFAYGTSGGPGPMTLGAVPGSAVNAALNPTLRLDEHGVLTHASLMGTGTADPQAITNANLRRWGQLPVQPSADSPNWRDLAPTDLGLLQQQAGWAESVSNARRQGESMFKFRGSWYMLATTSPTGFRVLGGGSGSNGVRYIQGVGQVKANFQVVTQNDLNATAAGLPLQQAAGALNAYIAAHGVPNEHVYNPVVYAFQTAYNADQVSDIENNAAGDGKLNEDGEYGPNTQAAYGAILAIAAPAPDTAQPASSSSSSTSTTTTTTTTSYTVPAVAAVLIVAAGAVGYAAHRHQKKKGGGHHRHAHA